jgi:hypothetical protein
VFLAPPIIFLSHVSETGLLRKERPDHGVAEELHTQFVAKGHDGAAEGDYVLPPLEWLGTRGRLKRLRWGHQCKVFMPSFIVDFVL